MLIPNVGLAITLFDIQSYGELKIHPGDADAYCVAKFRLIVFRPFPNEILVGTVLGCHEEIGVQLSMKFFKHILIPTLFLPNGAEFDPMLKAWTWRDPERREPVTLLPQTIIRFKVTSTSFYSLNKPPVKEGEEASQTTGSSTDSPENQLDQKNDPDLLHFNKRVTDGDFPMIVRGTLLGDGLGLATTDGRPLYEDIS
ncbi:putative DNA-directed RNA polymerase III subunit RPC8 [Monocercomonoides exilis]|uniref:putative DNA-directed RNA polymerase III subunit RPC8 n=1 Tax=Monocercomonoides exilis TaxID=2049356 RepID=UPI0035595C8F|nr:putative DNA-directed RNA polymerase III subunit RPC8 [Monocercomonoides exilis]|eukprot:MONOS_112.1-p1 / transcript=MONOS_112.1 / gene=MONOS_112 / organism=Monocercomonoides_exilis_PA203 / gene_product=DNA-directed RNA polymerase III subunit RPC8 / transcript_product=DNA-directed RNA polymerase III subunit RPC8 / location=Mono_scaffold00002:170406-171331(-) / protein_length=198 / sequence_SO=supercontig / SO=protein_coding / is_pseudo=false